MIYGFNCIHLVRIGFGLKSIRLLALVIFAALTGVSTLVALDSSTPRYYFATFRNDQQTKLYLTSSFDGRSFTTMTGSAVYTSPLPETLRDPSIIKLADGYYVCHTTGTNLGNAPYFSILKSTDLVNWIKVTDVSMASIPNTNYTWAPEWYQDEDGSVHILVSVSPLITREHRLYEIHPTVSGSWTAWSAPVELTGTAFPAFSHPAGSIAWVGYYDAYVVKRSGEYYLFYFDVSTSFIHCAKAPSLTGPYTAIKTGNWQGIGYYKEGGTMIHLGGSSWRFYFANAITSTMYFTESADNWVTWTAQQALGSSAVFNHGTVIFNTSLPAFEGRVTAESGGVMRTSFPAINKNGYRVQWSNDLITWNTIGADIQGTGGWMSRDHSPGSSPKTFYRVKWLPFHVPTP